MRILNRYFWQETSVSILLIMLGLISIFSFIDLIQELDDLGKGTYDIKNMLIVVALSIPGHVYEIIPIAVLIGMMVSLGILNRHSELTVMRVSGLSILDIAKILVIVGSMFTIITFLIGETVTPISEKLAQKMRIQATESVIAQQFNSGLWIKDGKTFVNIKNVLPDSTLLNIKIYELDEHFKLRSISHAKKGSYVKKRWRLNEVVRTQFNYAENIENNTVVNQFSKHTNWDSVIRPELLNVLLVAPEKMSVWNLYSFIHHLNNNNQKTTRYSVALWSKLIYPLACIVMVALALPFGFFIQQRATDVSTKIFIGILIGVTYQIMNRVFVHLGVLNDWSPFISAITPTALFFSAGLVLIAKTKQH